MKVLRLVMTSFGTQQNKIIDFSENVNLIMGSDKGTLQTVRSFLDGMLFGLSADDKKRYRPKRLPYSGSMFISVDNNKQLRVDRNFLNGKFKVTDSDGNDVTEEYSDEYGDLALLPLADSIFNRESFRIPDSSEKDRRKLSDLKAKRRTLNNRYNYDEMLEQRRELLEILNEHKALEEEMEHNSSMISENEAKIKNINEANDDREARIDREIANLKQESEQISEQIEGLKSEQAAQGAGRAQVLRRNVQGAEEQLQIVNRKLEELHNEEDSYIKKLEDLNERFNLDREELKSDYEKYQEELKIESDAGPEPLVNRMAAVNKWLYICLIAIGVIGISLALFNPDEILQRVPVFFICFVSVFLILISVLAFYLKYHKAPVDDKTIQRIQESERDKIFKKYNQNSEDEFVEFYNNAKKVFVHIDDLESDLSDIRREIAESETERERISEEKKSIDRDLATNRDQYQDDSIQEKIVELAKERNKISAKIDELEEERHAAQTDSVWKLKEEAMKLEETNLRLRRQSGDSDSVVDDFYKLQKRIDRYESRLSNLNKQIENIEESIAKNREDFILNYATPGEKEFEEKMAKQFSFGLQRNLEKGYDVPLITYNPFTNAGGQDEILINKFRTFILGRQVLVFSNELDEQRIFKSHNIKHNGIFIANPKAH